MGAPASLKNSIIYPADQVAVDGDLLTPRFTYVNTNGAADLVFGISAARIRVLALAVTATAIVEAVFKSGASTTIAKFYVDSTTILVLPFNPLGWFQTEDGEKLAVQTTDETTFVLVYVEVPA